MPVSNISAVGVSCSTVGAGRWIGQRSWTSIGSPWSMTSPSRLKMRPRVTLPTGTVMGPPVSMTSVPRESPSVVSIATARTRSSPRCCWTSSTRCVPVPAEMPSCSSGLSSRSITIAELISGSSSGKTASTTTPWISSIRPTLRPSRRSCSCCSWVAAINLLGQALRPGDHFHDLLGDRGLALAVHLQGVFLDQLAGVLRRVAHRGHARSQLGRGGLQQRPVERDLDVGRDQAREDLLRVGLVLDQRGVAGLLEPRGVLGLALLAIALILAEDRRLLERQQRLVRHALGERGDVAVVD